MGLHRAVVDAHRESEFGGQRPQRHVAFPGPHRRDAGLLRLCELERFGEQPHLAGLQCCLIGVDRAKFVGERAGALRLGPITRFVVHDVPFRRATRDSRSPSGESSIRRTGGTR
ncbi:hypothetical protein ASF40_16945 [Microbacterium sp. Leaf288]|nr:hypothetical protein ASF40_16945 [Microbacterium sp. Leaf288]